METTIVCWDVFGLFMDNGKENGNYRDYRGLYRELWGIYWGNIWMMEKKMETTGIIGVI